MGKAEFEAKRKARKEQYEQDRLAILGDLVNPQVTENTPNCKCGDQMVKRFGKGEYYCPLCNIWEKDLQTVKVSKEKATVKDSIRAENNNHPLRGFFRRFAEKMMNEHGYKHNVIFRNMRAGNHQKLSNGTHQIKLGYSLVDHFAENNFEEYKTYRYLWQEFGELTGKKAMWAVAIHEVAHAVQSENNGRWRGSAHNSIWASAVEDLQVLYPFEEVQNI